jgi:hypothetical protein
MTQVSRRHALRAIVSASGVVAGASALPGPALLEPADAAGSRKVRAHLAHSDYRPGQTMVLRIHHAHLKPGYELHVADTKRLGWRRVHAAGHPARYTATARGSGSGTIRVKVLRPDGRVVHDPAYHAEVEYRIHGGMRGPLVGMGAQGSWDRRLSEVGPGVAARRIFADLSVGPQSSIKVVEEAHAAGMLPVISYEVGGDVTGAINGRFDAAAKKAAAQLRSYDLPTAVVLCHEPYPDMSPAHYAAVSRRLLPFFKHGKLRVGPLLNGWLLDRRQDTFASFCPDDLLRLWDWVGIDTYQNGTAAAPGDVMPGRRLPALSTFLAARGHGYLPLGVGEYNGWTAAAIAGVGKALFTTPNVWFGCLWNNTGGVGRVLTGDRLTAFQHTLQDPRNLGPRHTR